MTCAAKSRLGGLGRRRFAAERRIEASGLEEPAFVTARPCSTPACRNRSIFDMRGFLVRMHVLAPSCRFWGLAGIVGTMLLECLDAPFKLKELSVSNRSA